MLRVMNPADPNLTPEWLSRMMQSAETPSAAESLQIPNWMKAKPETSDAAEVLRRMAATPAPSPAPIVEKSVAEKLEMYVLQGQNFLKRKPFDKSAGLQWLRRIRTALVSAFGKTAPVCIALDAEIRLAVKSGYASEAVSNKLEELKVLVAHLKTFAELPMPQRAAVGSSLIQIDDTPVQGRQALVVSCDLAGFSDFCNHPDTYQTLPKFLSRVFAEINKTFTPGLTCLPAGVEGIPTPEAAKFTGDGGIFIWFLPEENLSAQSLCTSVVLGFRRVQKHLGTVIPQWGIEWRAPFLPSKLKVGIACGLVYPLKVDSAVSSSKDYVGYSINLAVRLQNHCPEIGFIIHEPVLPRVESLLKLIACGMKGTKDEPVLIFADEDLRLEAAYLLSKFRPTGPECDDRIKATWPENPSERHRLLTQARFFFRMEGGPMNGVVGFFAKDDSEFHPITPKKDESGKVVGKQKSIYRLKSRDGFRLVYEFVRNEPLPPQLS